MEKRIEFFKNKISDGCSELENIVYSEAITLLNSEVNPDKVTHWVNMVLNTFDNKPKPLSLKEKQKREQKRIRKQMKNDLLLSLNTQMKELLEQYGVISIGFINYRDISVVEHDDMRKFIEKKGYFFNDVGDGAFEPFVSKVKLGAKFYKDYNDLRDELEDFNSKKIVLNEYQTSDVDKFRNIVYNIE